MKMDEIKDFPSIQHMGSYLKLTRVCPITIFGKAPQKSSFHLWFLENGEILTKANMIMRKCQGSPTCYFYSCDGSNNHLFMNAKLLE